MSQSDAEPGGELGEREAAAQVGQGEQGLSATGQPPPPRPELPSLGRQFPPPQPQR